MIKLSSKTAAQDWAFYAEGGANKLYAYHGSYQDLKGKLLRVRRHASSRSYIPTFNAYKFLKSANNKLSLPLIDHELILVTPEFLKSLPNHEDVMTDDPHALLMENCVQGLTNKAELSKYCSLYTNNENDRISDVAIEIKPKWLYDVRTKYCRNCLMKQLKSYPRHFCCIDLLDNDRICKGVSDLVSAIPSTPGYNLAFSKSLPLKEILIQYLSIDTNIFQRLRKWQIKYNTHDPLNGIHLEGDVTENVLLLMALRDVGVFIRIQKIDTRNQSRFSGDSDFRLIELEEGTFLLSSRIIDFDLKSASKFNHWKDTEARLRPFYDSEYSDWPLCCIDTR